MYSWADVMGYEAFLDDALDPEVREETRRKTIELFRIVDRGGCRHRALVRHFDETIEPCATSCDACRGAGIETLVAMSPGHAKASAPQRPTARVSGTGATAANGSAAASGNPQLFERLRALRKRLADAEGVPAYIVFSDAVLRSMASSAPRTRAEMLEVPGVGPVKLERYGDAFLEALRDG
jgi:ATP-dependent DNA helicase RecQ